MKVKFVIILLMMTVSLSYAGSYEKAGTSGMQFLKFGASARAVGMAEAFSAVSGDINTIYYNPAGVFSSSRMDTSFMYTKWFQGLSFINLAAKLKVDPIGDLALGFLALSFGDITRTVDSGGELVKTGDTIYVGDWEIIANYSKGLHEKLIVGINLKLVHETLDNIGTTSIMFDPGVIYKMLNNINLGLSILNLGTKPGFINEKISLPIIFRGGINYKLLFEKHYSFLIAGDLEKPNDSNFKFNLGLESLIYNIFYLRTGYKIGSERGGYKLGGGILIKKFRFDYSFDSFGELGTVHRFELNWKFHDSVRSKNIQKKKGAEDFDAVEQKEQIIE